MEDSLDRGWPFEAVDLWRSSNLVDKSEKNDSLFDFPDTPSSFFELDAEQQAHFTFDTRELGLPELPPISLPNLEQRAESNNLPNLEPAESDGIDDEALAIWESDLSRDDTPRLCTWETFNGKVLSDSGIPALLSEAGPLVLDAAFQRFTNAHEYNGAMPQDAALRSLCHLVLGRSSIFFQWRETKECFTSVVEHVSISGLSLPCSSSFIAELTKYGTLVVKLRRFAEASANQTTCPSLLAFRSGISTMMNAVNESVFAGIAIVNTLLHLGPLIKTPYRLLKFMWSSVELTRSMKNDTAVISAFADHVYTSTQADERFRHVYKCLLARVAMPWLQELATDLGLDDAYAMPAHSHSDGEIQEESPTLTSPSAKIKREKENKSFLTPDESELIRETKLSLSLMHQNMSNHPLISWAKWSFKPPVECLYEASLDPTLVAKNTAQYEAIVVDAVNRYHRGATTTSHHSRGSPIRAESDIYSQTALGHASPNMYVQDLDTQMSEMPVDHVQADLNELFDAVTTALRSQRVPSLTSTSDLTFNMPFSIIRHALPLVKAQHRLANGALIRHVLRNCDLYQHLRLHRSFHLLQSGDFVDRLSMALFSADVQAAVRSRGVAPTGQVIGLHLGASDEQRWPPASSELQLTLMGILSETYTTHGSNSDINDSIEALPGDLSFAIRELSEDEIERVLDAGSIHALDFLRLQYTAPPLLDAILTPDALQKYDDIFRFLLVLLRLSHVVKELRIQTCVTRASHGPGAQTSSQPAIMFVLEAHHFVTVLMSHTMDVGINASWRSFSRSLEELERCLQREDAAGEIMTRTTMGIEGLRRLHDEYLERIRSALFLRKRHEKLRQAVNTVLSTILTSSAKMMSVEAGSGNFHTEGAALRQSTSAFYSLLQDVIDQPLKSSKAGQDLNTEAEDFRILLLRLRWNGSS